MRANEIMRGVLDVLNRIECGLPMPASMPQSTTINMISIPAPTVAEPVVSIPIEPVVMDVEPEVVPVEDDETRRFKQIMDILVTKDRVGAYSNSPNETVAGINSVTTDAGGGLNGPKHPADIRADSVAMYPNFSAKN
jgi:hypothetical protein